MQEITVQKSILPFKQGFSTIRLDDVKTVEDVVNKTIPYSFKDCKLLVTLNNELIAEDRWCTPVKEKDIVGLNFVPAGGKGGKTALSIAVVVAAVALAAYGGPALAGALGFSSAAGATVSSAVGYYAVVGSVYVATSMVASMALGALTAVPKQGGTRAGEKKESSVYSISGASNAIDKYGVIPINLGTNRMFPKQAALPYVENFNNDQYVRQLFTWGYGNVSLSDIKLGDTLLSQYSDYIIQNRLNSNLNSGSYLYSNDVYELGLNINVKQTDGWILRTSHTDTDEIIVDIVFNGLVYINDSGGRTNTTVVLEVQHAPTGTNNWSQTQTITVTGATTQPLRKSFRIVLSSKGQYDVRVRRITADNTNNSRLQNESYWSVLRSITYVNPVNFADISGTAIRMKATDQLNGTIDSLNAVVSTKVKRYDPNTGLWVDNVVSSNPADIFRYVLQSPAFAKRLPDNKIDLEKLAEWWVFCDENNLSYNKIIDSDISVDDVLNDICAAGMATLSKVDNIYSVIIDNERPIVKGLITPRNSWDYEGSIVYPELPHALRIEFRNAEKGYETDERIVYRDGYDESNATLYERLQFDSCTNADLAYWYGRRYFATALLQPETHTFKMDFENLTFNRGDRISLVNDVILVGVGQGRIKRLITSGNSVTGFEIDDDVALPNTNVLGVRIRDNTSTGFTYYLLNITQGRTKTFTFVESLTTENAPSVGSLCAFVEDGKELDLIVTQIKPSSNHSATITAVDYAPARFNPIGVIPPFDSKITSAWDLLVPVSPVLSAEIQTGIDAVLKNSDGTYTSTMVIPLSNRNAFPVEPSVKCRNLGATEWFSPRYIKKDADEVIITGLQDGATYDFRIYYNRIDGEQQTSLPLELNGVHFIGGSEPPADVLDFKVSVMNGIGLFEWSANEDFDLSHYIIKFSNLTENVSWNTSQVVYEKLFGTTVNIPIHKGTYLIKAVDYFGNESNNATTITSYDEGAFDNVVETLTQEPTWSGTKEGISVVNGHIRLSDNSTSGWYYLSPFVFDLGDVYTCLLLSNVNLGIVSRHGESRLVRTITAVRSVKYIRSTEEEEDTNYTIHLEMATSNDNITWSDWKTFRASQHTFRYIKFRLYMETDSLTSTPEITNLSILIDMPDRYESGEDIQITSASDGKEIEYSTAFRNTPSVNITIQDGAVDDKIEFIQKTNSGFTIKVFNATLNTYVNRSFDYIAAGYGKVVE